MQLIINRFSLLDKNKKATINYINDDDKCFQYATTVVALSHEDIKAKLQRISKSKPLINKRNWKGINCPSGKDDLKVFKKTIQKKLLLMCYMLKIQICALLHFKSQLKS